MKHILVFFIAFLAISNINAQDIIKTQNSYLTIHPLGHGTLYIDYQGKIVHIDPWMRAGDYNTLPDADYVLITHQHGDHLDKDALSLVMKKKTSIITTQKCQNEIKSYNNIQVMANGDSLDASWIKIKAVPAYNIVHIRDSGSPYHPKGEGNGYVITIDGASIYIAGDTENIPEMNQLKNIDVAFLPMNLPYTMTPEMAAEAAKIIQPKILYPYHYGNSDTNLLVELLKNSGIEVRVRDMK